MQAYWNKLVVDRPPTTSWRCASYEFDSRGFLKTINKATLELESQELFKTEAAILSRLIYRMKSKLRSDKGFKNMEKVNRALLNYLKLSLEKDYEYLRENTECEGNIKALPSRQMLQYTLVRTQGFAKLMCRIESVARIAADFFKTRISLGQAWNLSIVVYATISRIWLVARYLIKKCCEWYNRMYKYLDKLKLVGVAWIPEDHYFPDDLNSWLSLPWISDDLKKAVESNPVFRIPTGDGFTDRIFSLITSQGDTEEDQGISVTQRNESPSPGSPAVKSSIPLKNIGVTGFVSKSYIDSVSASPVELGERISRETFTADRSKKTSKKRKIVELKKDEFSSPVSPAGKSIIPVIDVAVSRIASEPHIEGASASPVELGERISRDTFIADRPKKTSAKRKIVEVKNENETKKKIHPERKSTIAKTKSDNKKITGANDIATKEDIVEFISTESYPGFDKLQWKIMRNNVSKLLVKLNKYEDKSSTKKHDELLKKVIKSIREWIN